MTASFLYLRLASVIKGPGSLFTVYAAFSRGYSQVLLLKLMWRHSLPQLSHFQIFSQPADLWGSNNQKIIHSTLSPEKFGVLAQFLSIKNIVLFIQVIWLSKHMNYEERMFKGKQQENTTNKKCSSLTLSKALGLGESPFNLIHFTSYASLSQQY